MADGKPKRPQYALPDEYGPARPPRKVEEDTDPAVRTVPRDAPAADAPATDTPHDGSPSAPPPPTRREQRELRQSAAHAASHPQHEVAVDPARHRRSPSSCC